MNLSYLIKPSLFFITLFIFLACSDNENEEEKIDIQLKLQTEKTTISPFEELKVKLTPDLNVLSANYDSLRWKYNGTFWDGTLIIGGLGEESDDYIEHSFADYNFGKHKIEVYGYKNDEIISQDIIEYEVIKPTGDFFNINWKEYDNSKDFYKTHAYFTTFKDVSNEYWEIYTRVQLGLVHSCNNKKQKALLRFTPWRHTSNKISRSLPDINSIDWFDETDEGYTTRAEMEYTFLHEYMVSLYGEPVYIYSGEDVTQTNLTEKYEAWFAYHDSDAYPIEIWSTPTTAICLLQYNSIRAGVNTKAICLVVAEPHK